MRMDLGHENAPDKFWESESNTAKKKKKIGGERTTFNA